MSSIRDALEKAQKEKDAEYPKYRKIFLVPKRKPGTFTVRPIWLISLFVILLAFGLYSLLDSGGRKIVAAHRNPKPEAKPSSEIVVDAKGFYDRARHLHKMGRLKNAKTLYQKTLELDEEHVYALNNLGVIHIQEGDYSEARKNLENAVRLKPDYVDPHYNLACLYAVKGEVKKSLGYLRMAVSLDKSVREWARKDRDLQNLRGVPGFEEMMKRP